MTHRKHANIKKRSNGFFGPNEIAVLGTKCSVIQDLVDQISLSLRDRFKVAYADASHSDKPNTPPSDRFTFHHAGSLASSVNYNQNPYQDKLLLSAYDLVMINGNHFRGQKQILVLDKEKEASLYKRLDQITDVVMLVRAQADTPVFDFLQEKIPEGAGAWCEIQLSCLAGRPHEELVRYARRSRMDLIVLGVRGRGLVESLMLGSTTDRVIRQTTCPVLSVCPPRSESQ